MAAPSSISATRSGVAAAWRSMTWWVRLGRPSRMLVAATSSSSAANDASRLLQPLWALIPFSFLRAGSRRLSPRRSELLNDLFLDLAQSILAEEHLVADEEGRRAELAARDRTARVVDQLLLDVILLCPRDQTVDIDAGGQKCVAKDLRIVHLLRLDPHVMIGGAKIRLEQALELRRDHAAHQHQGVHREERVRFEFRDVMAPQEALGFERIVFRLVLDATQRFARRHVAGRLVDAAEQHRDIIELHAGALLDLRQHQFGEIGIGTAEIEVKLDLERFSHRPVPFPSTAAVARRPFIAFRCLKFYFRTVNFNFSSSDKAVYTTS